MRISPRVAPEKCPSARKAVRYYAARLEFWRGKMGAGPQASSKDAVGVATQGTPRSSCPRYLAHVLQRKARASRIAYKRWHRAWFQRTYEKWRCIHEHEGAWNSNTGNGYWGGLQMDYGFMHTYGPEFIRRYGTADRWPVYAQLIAAERAYHGFAGYGGRGFSPWGTRGMCGA